MGMMWRIAVVDDQVSVWNRMKDYFERYTKERGERFQLTFFENAMLFLDHYKPQYDIILMDIDMPGMNGMEAAHRLRELDEAVVLVFVTNLAQYAINGYEVSAVDFIVKPVDYSKFAFKLTRALRLVPDKERAVVLLRTESGTVTVEQEDILYVEVDGHNLYYHTEKETYRIRGSLKQAESELPPPAFFLCNKCYLVNLAHVEEVSGNTVTLAGETVSVSRPKKKAFMEALAAYYNQ